MRIVVGAVVFGGLCLFAANAEAQGGFVSINAALQQPATSAFTQVGTAPYRQETFRFQSEYTVSSDPAFDMAGGVMFNNVFGMGIGVTRATGEHTAAFQVTIPNPWYFNRNVTHSGTTEEALRHVETGVHIQAVFVPPTSDRLQVMIFGGPTRIEVQQKLVKDVRVNETGCYYWWCAPYDFTVRSTIQEDVNASGWGFHAGVDVGYFFTDNVGIGGLVRLSRATVQLKNAPQAVLNNGTEITENYSAGGITAGAGLRLRF